MRSLWCALLLLTLAFPLWGEEPSLASQISTSDLVKLHNSLTFARDERSRDYLKKTLELTDDFLRSRRDIGSRERKQLEASAQKIKRFVSISDGLSDCGNGLEDKRALSLSASLSAGQVHHCEFYEGVPEVPAAVSQTLPALTMSAMAPLLLKQSILDTLTSQLGMKRLLPFAGKKTNSEICQEARENFPELKDVITRHCQRQFRNRRGQSFASPVDVKDELNKRAKKLNDVIRRLNQSINQKLRTYQQQHPNSNALDWKEELAKIAPTDPLYQEYLQLYHEQTADELGRLTNIPPLDRKFGRPIEFDPRRLPTPINGTNGVSIRLPFHAATNYSYSAEAEPSIDLDEDNIDDLVETITEHQEDVSEELKEIKDIRDPRDKMKNLLRKNPFSIGSVLMEHPNSTPEICSLMGQIMRSDRNKELAFKTVDYVALGVGVIPVFGWGATALIRGGSLAARALVFAGRAASGRIVGMMVAGTTGMEAVNVFNKMEHFNELVTTLRQTVLGSDDTPQELKDEFDRAQKELDAAIFEAKVLGAMGGVSLGIMGRNLMTMARNMDPKQMAEAMRTMAANLRAKSKNYQFPTDLVLRNSTLGNTERAVAAKTLVPNLTPEQVDAVMAAHRIGENTSSVYRYTPQEISLKYQKLLDAGIGSEDARILVRSGLAGAYQEGTAFERALARLPGVGTSPGRVGLKATFQKIDELNLSSHLSLDNLQNVKRLLSGQTRGRHTIGLSEADDIPAEVLNFIERAIKDQRIGSLRGLTEDQRRLVANARTAFSNNENALEQITRMRDSHSIVKDGVRYLTGVPRQIRAKPGHTLVYKGTAFPDGPIISQSMVGRSAGDIPRGDQHFLSYYDGQRHANIGGANLPDGISVSTHPSVATHYSENVVVFEVPNEVFEQLPAGDPALAEKVFKYMIPDEYRVLTTDKATMTRYNEFFHPSKRN